MSRPILAAAALLLALLPGAAAQSDAGTTLETAILDVLLERGLIERAQYDELLELARAKAAQQLGEIDLIEARLERLRAPEVKTDGGGPGKLVFKSADGDWSLNLKGRIQARVTSLDSDTNSSDGVNFSVPRARLGLSGNAGGQDTTYKLEIDASTSKSLNTGAGAPTKTDAVVRDAWVQQQFESGDAFRFGQFKVPFGREEQISSGSISLMERSIASSTFAPGHEPGAMYHGATEDGELTYEFALSNGEGQGNPNSAGNSRNGLRQAARVTWMPLGGFKLDGPSFQTLKDGGTKVALGAGWMAAHDTSGKTTLAPGTDTTTTNLEFQLFSGPWSFLAEVFDRSADPSAGADVDDRGNTAQLGYFLVPGEWELVARSSEVDFDTAADIDELVFGINRYLDGHNAKWMFDVVQTDSAAAGADSTEFRLQYQGIF